jgi:hypothetical protein
MAIAFLQTGWMEAVADPMRIPSLNWTQRSDWVNVKEKGVIGDGVADDTVALQTVLSTVKSGMVFYFPPGTYRITKMLNMTGPALGVSWLGHGRDTRIVWDGEENGTILCEDGFAQNARYEGFIFDGRGKAGIGFWHNSNTRFETEEIHRNMAFVGFRKSGIHMELNWRDKGDKYATAEIVFQNCLFEDCGTGVWSGSFNDYNYTYEGCEFIRCGTGIYCSKGNFYVRNSHFEGSRDVDISSMGEHGSSVRRVTSWKSKSFIRHSSSVAPITVEDCHIGAWGVGEKGVGPDGCAIVQAGIQMLIFDCSFKDAPDGRPPVFAGGRVIYSACRTANGAELCGMQRGKSAGDLELEKKVLAANVIRLPDGERAVSRIEPQTSFLKSEWNVPGKVFDIRLDFGAKGDGKTDDTKALQGAIDAARKHAKNAIAYLPAGNYVISETIRMEGADYIVGGSGPLSRIIWRGAEGGTMLAVHNPDRLRLENIMIGHHDGGIGKNSIDIMQTDSRPSSIAYEAVFVFGMYQKKPLERGLQFRDLSKDSLVVLDRVNGNLHFTDCDRATIFAPVSYEGSLVIDGKKLDRDGFMGFQTRLSTIVAGALYLQDNHSLVLSDFFVEQADSGYHIDGAAGLPKGRVTIQAPKLHLSEKIQQPPPDIQIRDYEGEILLGPMQFSCWPAAVVIRQEGDRPVLITLLASKFYECLPDWQLGQSARLALLANQGFGPYDQITKKLDKIQRVNSGSDLQDNATEKDRAIMTNAFDDLRKLGELDLRLNYPNIHKLN